jgi:SAM-dependent methyltransferase
LLFATVVSWRIAADDSAPIAQLAISAGSGDLKAIRELKRVLQQDGSLLFVVPVGKPKVQFNAHRIYSYQQISEYFRDLKLEEFALIPNRPKDGGLIAGAASG